MKMPDPITVPMTMRTRSRNPSVRFSSVIGPSPNVGDAARAVVARTDSTADARSIAAPVRRVNRVGARWRVAERVERLGAGALHGVDGDEADAPGRARPLRHDLAACA